MKYQRKPQRNSARAGLGQGKKTAKKFTIPVWFRLVGILVIILTASFCGFIFASLKDLSGIRALETYRPPAITQVLDVKGRLISEFYKERRQIVPLSFMPSMALKATLSTEDKRFYSHYGLDPWRIAKAVLVNLSTFSKEQGGSTISIQLSKLLFLNNKKTFKRKLQELWYTVQIEKQYSKDEIMFFYMNLLNYGHGSYGIEAAAQFFFEKPSGELGLAESALIAGIPKSPVYYSPLRFQENAMRRHRIVLLLMVKNKYIESSEAYAAYRTFWRVYAKNLRTRQSTFSDYSKNFAPHFSEYIRNKLERDLGSHALYSRGLLVYTTIDKDHQRAAQESIDRALLRQNRFAEEEQKKLPENLKQEIFARIGPLAEVLLMGHVYPSQEVGKKFLRNVLEEKVKPVLEGFSILHGFENLWQFSAANTEIQEKKAISEKVEAALLSISPSSGYITAMIGGASFSYYNQINRAVSLRRQIGSILKPFIYAQAIEKNVLRASSILNDTPTLYGNYLPKNYSGTYRGPTLVRDALKKSVNVLAVDTLNRLGIDETRDSLAKIFNAVSVRRKTQMFPNDLTMALGSGGFSPISVAVAYAVLANEGKEVRPRSIRYITDSQGEILKNYEEEYLKLENRQLLSPEAAYIILQITKDVFSPGGTAYKPRLLRDFKHRKSSFGKTGTTQNWKDAWFAGANKLLSTAVWLGYDDNRSLGYGRTGGGVAAPVWIRFQKQALQADEVQDFTQPVGIVKKRICRQEGTLAGPYTPQKDSYEEYFKLDNAPEKICSYTVKRLKQEGKFVENLLDRKTSSKKDDRLRKLQQASKLEEDIGEK